MPRKNVTPDNQHTLLKQLREEIEHRRRQREIKSKYASMPAPASPDHLLHAYRALSEADKKRVLDEILSE